MIRAALTLALITISLSFMASLPHPTPLQRGTQFQVAVLFSPQSHQGFHKDRIELKFKNPRLDPPVFFITRNLCGLVGVAEEYESLKPTAPFKPRKVIKFWKPTLLDGEKPPALGDIRWKTPLPHAHVPQVVKDALAHEETVECELDVRQLLPNDLNSESYAEHWQVLMHVEEEKMRFAFFMMLRTHAHQSVQGGSENL
jgi:hypothetical protein